MADARWPVLGRADKRFDVSHDGGGDRAITRPRLARDIAHAATAFSI